MIAPRIVGSPSVGDSNNVIATSLVIAKPSTAVTVQDGDILVAILRCGSSTQTTDYSASGWTRRGLGFAASSAAARVTGVFTHYVTSAAGEPSSYTFTLTSNTFARQAGMIFVVRPGVGATPWGTEPTYITATGYNGGPPSYPNSVSGITADSMALYGAANETVSPGVVTWTPPTGTTYIGDHGSLTTQGDTSATRSVVAAAYEVVTGTTAGGSAKAGAYPSYSSNVSLLLVIPGTDAVVTPLTTWYGRAGSKWVGHRNGFSSTYGEFTLKGFTALKNWNSTVAWNIDVVRTSDSEFVASHDLTTGRVLSGTNLTITTSIWADISGKTTLVGGNPVTRLDDIVGIAPVGTVFFIDNKSNTNQAALATKLAALGLSPSNVVYKIGASSTANFTSARANGYTTWAYGFDSDMSSFASNISSIDWIGFDYAGTQANWNTVIAYGKPSLAHILSTTVQKTTADTKAVTAGGNNFGYMVTDVGAVIPPDQSLTFSEWDGTAEHTLTASWWNGTTERPIKTSIT